MDSRILSFMSIFGTRKTITGCFCSFRAESLLAPQESLQSHFKNTHFHIPFPLVLKLFFHNKTLNGSRWASRSSTVCSSTSLSLCMGSTRACKAQEPGLKKLPDPMMCLDFILPVISCSLMRVQTIRLTAFKWWYRSTLLHNSHLHCRSVFFFPSQCV